jgi:5-methylcytosine-specific restriction endonuclease McrA
MNKNTKRFTGTCTRCHVIFKSTRKQKFCSKTCRKLFWKATFKTKTKKDIETARANRKTEREKKIIAKQGWEEKLLGVVKKYHKRNCSKIVERILKRTESVKNSMIIRSKKFNVECPITVEELREIVYNSYGTKCRYCPKTLTIQNLVFDHILPISKGGHSSKENLQVICKTSNTMKGSLEEANYNILLEWLETIPEELKKDISIRLARGIH